MWRDSGAAVPRRRTYSCPTFADQSASCNVKSDSSAKGAETTSTSTIGMIARAFLVLGPVRITGPNRSDLPVVGAVVP